MRRLRVGPASLDAHTSDRRRRADDPVVLAMIAFGRVADDYDGRYAPTTDVLDQLAQSLAIEGSLGRADTLRSIEALDTRPDPILSC